MNTVIQLFNSSAKTFSSAKKSWDYATKLAAETVGDGNGVTCGGVGYYSYRNKDGKLEIDCAILYSSVTEEEDIMLDAGISPYDMVYEKRVCVFKDKFYVILVGFVQRFNYLGDFS